MAKSTDAEVELRIATVYSMIIQSIPRINIVRYGAKEWNISSRQIDDYIARAKIHISEAYGDNYKKDVLNTHLAQLDDLQNKNYKEEDYKEVRAIIESRSKLLGLNAPDKSSITITQIQPLFPDV